MKESPLFAALLDAAYWVVVGGLIGALFGTTMPGPGILFNIAYIGLTGTAASSIIRLIHRRKFRERTPDRTEAVFYAAAALAGGLAWYALDFAVFGSLFQWNWPDYWRRINLATNLVFSAMPLLVWSSLRFSFRIVLYGKKEEARLSDALALARNARRRMLRDQLNPHFLFNALNSIFALIEENPAKAGQMSSDLEEFLRYAMAGDGADAVPFRREWEATRLYFNIQKTRYEERLEVRYEVAPDCLEQPVPGFLLHPLAENAVKFGMKTSPMPLKIRVAAGIEGSRFRLTVANTGRWLSPDAASADLPPGTKTGLANLRSRLENSFPGRHAFSIDERQGWVEARLEIPVQGRSDS